jgi:mono/diheme cytochrome c family protein
MSPRVRWALAAVAALALAVAGLAASGVLDPSPAPVVVTPEAVARGREVYRYRCHTCHNDIPLAKRVAGWSAQKAYEVVGDLPKRYRSMPAFAGDDDERRAVAAFLQAVGEGSTSQYELPKPR